MCAQRQGTGSGQLRAPLRQVDGGVTEKGGRDRVVENERRAVDDLMAARSHATSMAVRPAPSGWLTGSVFRRRLDAVQPRNGNPGNGHPPMPLR